VEIEAAISRLPVKQEAGEWLEQRLEDKKEMTPQFLASLERGKAGLIAGRSRIAYPYTNSAAETNIFFARRRYALTSRCKRLSLPASAVLVPDRIRSMKRMPLR